MENKAFKTNRTYFESQNNICSDTCWMDYKNHGNEKIMNYQTYEQSSQLIPCETPNVRLPAFMLDHPNLRGRAGYGLTDSCLVDTYNDLLKNDELMTRDRCRIQLFSRIFTGVPHLKGCAGDINKELELLAGSDTNNLGTSTTCRKSLMELQTHNPIPLIDCMKDIQNPDNIVPIWVNGGEDTRSYINRKNFNKNI
jgi:hypothetical protein